MTLPRSGLRANASSCDPLNGGLSVGTKQTHFATVFAGAKEVASPLVAADVALETVPQRSAPRFFWKGQRRPKMFVRIPDPRGQQERFS